jgi:hypothetical protein
MVCVAELVESQPAVCVVPSLRVHFTVCNMVFVCCTSCVCRVLLSAAWYLQAVTCVLEKESLRVCATMVLLSVRVLLLRWAFVRFALLVSHC